MGYWARGRRANAAAYPPKPGPDREDLMRSLGLAPEADMRDDWRRSCLGAERAQPAGSGLRGLAKSAPEAIWSRVFSGSRVAAWSSATNSGGTYQCSVSA